MSRIIKVERDYSGFINTLVDETGAMVVNSAKGKSTPMYLQSEEDCLRELGTPSATYQGVFEAIAYTKKAPLWCVSAIGSNALYGGVDVSLSDVTAFGVGRNYTTFSYGSTTKGSTQSMGTGDGVVTTYSGVLSNVPITDVADFTVTVNSIEKDISLSSGGVLSGADIISGSVVLATGVYTMTFSGTPGVYATVTTDVDGSSGYNLSSGLVDKYIKITVDDTVKTINLGQSATTTKSDVITAINTDMGFTAATSSGNFIKLTGRKGSTAGIVTIADPTTGVSALTTIFSSGGTTLTNSGTAPVGVIPKYNEAITITYHYTTDTTSSISHSFFTTSPYTDDLALSVEYVSGSKFKASLYKVLTSGNSFIQEYNYSLIREKDANGNSIYYEDVFDEDKYLLFKINPAFTGTAFTVDSNIIAFSGGYRGATPTTSDFTTAWNKFQYANKYKAKIFMDCYGTHASVLNSLIQTYQEWGQAITCVPLGNSASEALSFRNSLALDTDDVCLYHNWAKIRDDYNNSFAWVSNVGSIGKKYASMSDVYDAASPAGIDENGHGGQLQDWTIIDVENDYTQAELDSFYNNQINPIILDDSYGLMVYGDQTLQVTNSDTSFVGTRRTYKYMVEVISKQILRKQEFKLNDSLHRLMAKTQTDSFVEPIKANGWIRDYKIICDESNNTDTVLNNRQFVLDFYVKITPNSQWVYLRLTRVGQNVDITQLIG
jgi:hypothetical protein